MTRNWIWISGWAIDPNRFKAAVEQALPDDSHEVVAPTPEALETVVASSADYIGGYSLGSLLLSSGLDRIPQTATIVCLAPFVAFCKEDRLGGATPRATVQSLQKRLRRQPQKTLQLFYRLAGLSDPLSEQLPYGMDALEWGLEQLATLTVNATGLKRVKAIAGLRDSLLNTEEIKSAGLSLYIADQCGHDYHQLLVALSVFRLF